MVETAVLICVNVRQGEREREKERRELVHLCVGVKLIRLQYFGTLV